MAWLVERHHQSLGLWPWTWASSEGEPYVTLYAACQALRFGDDFGALANWIEANRWPSVSDMPHPTTLYRDRIGCPDWSLASPLTWPRSIPVAVAHDVDQLARGGASVETLAQLLDLELAGSTSTWRCWRRNGTVGITGKRPARWPS